MVKTTNEEILDAVIRHQIFLLRHSGYVRNRVTTVINRSEEEIARRIRDQLRRDQGLSNPTEFKRMQALLAALEGIRKNGWKEATKLLLEDMQDLAYREPIILQSLYTTPVPVYVNTVLPSAGLLKEIALSRPFEGRVLKEWAANMEADDLRRIKAAVQAGMVAGETHATIARRVVGTARLQGADGATAQTRRQIGAVVRTAVQHIANGSRDAFFAANKDLFTEEHFVATLDSRTTPICRALDGKRFPVGEGPRPPLHFNCRSLRVAAMDGAFLGSRPAKPTTERLLVKEYADKNNLGSIGSRDGLPRGHKGAYDDWARGRIRQMTGPIPASQTYQTWLKKQSAAFQDDVLGDTKAKLFRNGDLTLDKFVDLNTGREFTLDELARKHADAFRAAGLDPKGF